MEATDKIQNQAFSMEMPSWIDSYQQGCQEEGIIADEICSRCGLDGESHEHLFFQCTELLLIWKIAPVKCDVFQHLVDSFEG